MRLTKTSKRPNMCELRGERSIYEIKDFLGIHEEKLYRLREYYQSNLILNYLSR